MAETKPAPKPQELTETVTFTKRHTHARTVYREGDKAKVTPNAARKLAKLGVIKEKDS